MTYHRIGATLAALGVSGVAHADVRLHTMELVLATRSAASTTSWRWSRSASGRRRWAARLAG
ncbi:hypothetical protein J2Z31_002738 [Sinorhizobium kostiense]|uniref:Uncharacterized protein n=1 Tax=Sinorhizobium kostiense TaxID=76747 RepID=A0ABS4R0L6_9HYPH|nr:hypothetical protein [Sinorhizobium kostiense]